MSEIYEFQHPEFSEELRKNHGSVGSLEAAHQDMVALIRAKVLAEIERCGVGAGRRGWLYYLFPKSGLLIEDGGYEDCLVLVEYRRIEIGSMPKPIIRIIYSERFGDFTSQVFFTMDMVVDHEGDAIYTVGARELEESDSNSIVPLVIHEEYDNSVSIKNMSLLPSYDKLLSDDGSVLAVFNTFDFPEDTLPSLEKIIDFCNKLFSFEPSYFGIDIDFGQEPGAMN